MIQVRMQTRVRGGWRVDEAYLPATAAEVGQLIRDKEALGGTPKQRLRNTRIGDRVLNRFAGTMLEIGECFKAAGEKHLAAWTQELLQAANEKRIDSLLAGIHKPV